MKQLLIEALVVGITAALVGLAISTILMFITSKDFSLEKYHFWPQVMLSYFITGVLLHLMYEYFGANKWYCDNGNACKN